MKHRYINGSNLLRVIRSALPAGRARDATVAAVERWLDRQPTSPALVGTTAAAKILGVKPPHVTRLREQGRMPDPIEVEGSVDVYVREEIEELGAQLRAERAARERKRAARNEETPA